MAVCTLTLAVDVVVNVIVAFATAGLKTLISDVPDSFGPSVAQRLTVRLLGGVEQDKTVRGGVVNQGGGTGGREERGGRRERRRKDGMRVVIPQPKGYIDLEPKAVTLDVTGGSRSWYIVLALLGIQTGSFAVACCKRRLPGGSRVVFCFVRRSESASPGVSAVATYPRLLLPVLYLRDASGLRRLAVLLGRK